MNLSEPKTSTATQPLATETRQRSKSRRSATSRLERSLTIRTGPLVLLALVLCSCVETASVRWEEDRSILFSADDKAIAYRHNGVVYVARTHGDQHHRIYTGQTGAIVSSPRWAPDRRGVAFAVSDGKIDESGRLPYTIWFWPAPEVMWESARENPEGDTATLPSHWTPAEPQKVVDAYSLQDVQIRGGAIFEWHPDGKHIVFLNADGPYQQSVLSVHVDTGEKVPVSPVRALNLACTISPDGNHQLCAADDPESGQSGLWLGPIDPDPKKWRRVESRPGPQEVPRLQLEAKPGTATQHDLLDLRPRLGAWSADSKWLAHFRLPDETDKEKDEEGRQQKHTEHGSYALVITHLAADKAAHLIQLNEGIPQNLHWSADGVRVGLLSDRTLVVADTTTGETVKLSGVQHVEEFIGWSATGHHMAYLTPADQFREVRFMLPSGHTVIWGPAQRHHLVIARDDGTTPESRFSRMNITAAEWAQTKPKLSFWATHLPTVSNLPPGDPAAVLDLEENTLKWYPTDVNEYAQVGHYYLLNGRYEEAADFYGDALEKLDKATDAESLAAQIHLWRGISRLKLGHKADAAEDLSAFRERIGSIIAAEQRAVADVNRPLADTAVHQELDADHILFSTLLSMDQLQLAAEEAQGIAGGSDDMRRIQAHCFLALIDQAGGDNDRYAKRMVDIILPGILALPQTTPEQVARVVKTNLESLTGEALLKLLSERTRQHVVRALLDLSGNVRSHYPEASRTLALAAVTFYREGGDIQGEIEALRLLTAINQTNENSSE